MSTFPPEKLSAGEMGLLVSDHVTAMLAYWDKDQVCRFANHAYLEWFGRSKEEMIDRITMKELLGPLYEKNLPYILGALAGKKQVFEREIPLQDGTTRHSLATYTPYIDGEIKGFFVHVADISYIKELEAKLLQSKKEMLRNVIEAQERERMSIEHIINENVNQMLVYGKMLLSHGKTNPSEKLNEEILTSINHAIKELKSLSFNLKPAAINHFGFIGGTEDYLAHIKSEYSIGIFFECMDTKIEDLDLQDKLSLFRIIQNFVLLLVRNSSTSAITIILKYHSPNLTLNLIHNDKNFILPIGSKEYMDIEQRLEYLGGKTVDQKTAKEDILQININIDNIIRQYYA